MRATTGCGARRSSSLRTKSRRRRPCRSSRWISLAMNVSDRRGKPVSRYAIEPTARLELLPGSNIHALENPAQALRAARELEASLDVRPPVPGETLPPGRPPGEPLERAGERLGITGRNEDTGPSGQDGGRHVADVARHHGAGARQRLEHDVR